MNFKQGAKKAYCVIKHPYPLWFYLFNRSARHRFERSRPVLNSTQERIMKDLFRDGIAFSSVEELFPNSNMLADLQSCAQTLDGSARSQWRKTFLQSFWDMKADLDFTNAFMRLSVHPALLDMANSYMRMLTRMKYCSLNLTTPVSAGDKPQFSQRWHRDPEEKKMLKVFIYLSDVTPESGPFTYARGSNHDGKFGALFPQNPPQGIYPAEGEVEKAIPSENIMVATGKAGTIIFCDTSGLHRGGYATEGTRLMYTAFYAAPSSIEKPWYNKTLNTEKEEVRPEVRFALHKE